MVCLAVLSAAALTVATPLGGDGAWDALLPPDPNDPPVRAWHTAIYDPDGDRMIAYGGANPPDDLWQLSFSGGPTWTHLTVSGPSPPRRSGHTAIYDPVRHRMVVFGGGRSLNDVWALSFGAGPAWTQILPLGTPPNPRSGHSAIYDPLRDRMIVFGGYTTYDPNNLWGNNDVWALSFSDPPTWTQLSPTLWSGTFPAARYGQSGIYDPVADRLLIFGGEGNDGNYFNDVWAFPLASDGPWIRADAGPPPPARTGHSAVVDLAGERMLMFGGTRYNVVESTFNDVWALPLAGAGVWSQVSTDGPPAVRYGHSAIIDPVRARMVVFGGVSGSYVNDCWALPLTGIQAWERISPPCPAEFPRPRVTHTSVYDGLRQRMIVFGGYALEPCESSEAWALSLGVHPTWSLIAEGEGPPPHEWGGYQAVIEESQDRLIALGGGNGVTDSLSEVWALPLAGPSSWARITPVERVPPGRAGFIAFFDSKRDRVVIFGGWAYRDLTGASQTSRALKPTPTNLDDVWALNLGGTPFWEELALAGPAPPPGLVAYDPPRDRLLDYPSDGSGVWSLPLDGAAWIRLSTANAIPPRGAHAYDPLRDRLEGIDDQTGQAWALSLTAGGDWRALDVSGDPPVPRNGQTLVFDVALDRAIMFGGEGTPVDWFATYHNDAWALQFDRSTSVQVSFLGAHVDDSGVRLSWYATVGAGITATVERRDESSEWKAMGEAASMSGGLISWLDTRVVEGTRYAYRLVIQGSTTAEVWVEVPIRSALEIARVQPNPAKHNFSASIRLPVRAPAVLELIDTAGRRVWVSDVGLLEPGVHRVELGSQVHLPPGDYVMRLSQNGRSASKKLVILR